MSCLFLKRTDSAINIAKDKVFIKFMAPNLMDLLYPYCHMAFLGVRAAKSKIVFF